MCNCNNLPRSSTPVNNTSSLRRNQTVSVDVSHNIVASALLLKRSSGELVVLNTLVLLQFRDSLLGDVEAELALRLGEVDPKLPPGAEAVARREEVLHLLGGVPRVEGAGAWVSIALRPESSSSSSSKNHHEFKRQWWWWWCRCGGSRGARDEVLRCKHTSHMCPGMPTW